MADSGLGEPSQRQAVRRSQRLLAEAIEQAGVGEFDGNEYGGGEVVLLRHGSVDDPAACQSNSGVPVTSPRVRMR